VAFLASMTADLTDRHALNSEALQGCLDFIELEWLNDRFDLFHRFLPSLPSAAQRKSRGLETVSDLRNLGYARPADSLKPFDPQKNHRGVGMNSSGSLQG